MSVSDQNFYDGLWSPLYEAVPHASTDAEVRAGWERGAKLVVSKDGNDVFVRSMTEEEREKFSSFPRFPKEN